jgi:hypothetical protein
MLWDMLNMLELASRLYITLLRLYPLCFQREFAEEMLAVFVEALSEARKQSIAASLIVVVRELRDLPVCLVREYWCIFVKREGIMNESIELGGKSESSILQAQIIQSPAPWWQAILAGLPHLLYPLSIEVPSLARVITSPSVSWRLLHNSFWVLVIIMLLISWRRKWPRWSASWVGYGSVMLFDFLISTAQTYFGSLLENEAVVLWLVITMAVFFWMARRDWLSGLLVMLPVSPMFFTYIALDGVKGTVPEALYFIAVGLLMMLVVMAIFRKGNLRVGVWLVLAVIVVISLPLSYATTYHSNRPDVSSYVPTVTDMGRDFLIGAIVYIIFAAPLWSLALWTKGRSWLARKKTT